MDSDKDGLAGNSSCLANSTAGGKIWGGTGGAECAVGGVDFNLLNNVSIGPLGISYGDRFNLTFTNYSWMNGWVAGTLDNNGFIIADDITGPHNRMNAYSSDAVTPANRPKWFITYSGWVEESPGDNAIEVAINSSILSAVKYSSQQVYIVNASGEQRKGVFDWVASFGNQRWLINYITSGESYVNAASIGTTINVLELTNRTSEANITATVGAFINSTKQ